ncbi:MAG: rRNA methyltransferase [Proteobacteria bacterium]|nr:rRNA methyltransferase [Pseudomonadota bacterium]
MNAELPAALRAALDRALEGASRKALAERARRTSQAYRAGRPSSGVIREADDALAYALTRAPATYAACARVFAEAARMAPGFAPATLLDAGVGTGAASWAAAEVWPGLASATWLDASVPFLELAGGLAAAGPAALSHAEGRRADLTAGGPWPQADLVVASYALAEITPDKQDSVIDELWASTNGFLALVEPGTPDGHGRILKARERLIGLGARLVAPCPHPAACPLAAPDWCHFSVRLPRSRDHRLAKDAEAPFEDEKFSYLVAARPGRTVTPAAPRILAPPRAGKPGTQFKLCTPSGEAEQRLVGKRDKAAFAAARRLDWGDTLG